MSEQSESFADDVCRLEKGQVFLQKFISMLEQEIVTCQHRLAGARQQFADGERLLAYARRRAAVEHPEVK